MFKIPKKIVLSIVSVFLFLTSCSQDEESRQVENQSNSSISTVASIESIVSSKKLKNNGLTSRLPIDQIVIEEWDGSTTPNPTPPDTETYTSDEFQLVSLIKSYRKSIGLSAINDLWHGIVRVEAKEHNLYMISTNTVNHNGFVERANAIIYNYMYSSSIEVKTVSEIIAYNYNTPQAALNAWLLSPGHKAVLDNPYFTDFGLKITVNPVNGRKYYTVIFVKMNYVGSTPMPNVGFDIY